MEKSIVYLTIIFFIILTINYIRTCRLISLNYEALDEYGISRIPKVYFNITKGLLLFFVFQMVDLNKRISEYFLLLVLIIPIKFYLKGLEFGLREGFFKTRFYGWYNSNDYAEFLGIIIIVSCFIFFNKKNKIYKIVSGLIGSLSIFLMFSVGQSRGVFLLVIFLFAFSLT